MIQLSYEDAIEILAKAEVGGPAYSKLESQLASAGYVVADPGYRWYSPKDVNDGVVKCCKLCSQWILTREYGGTELGCFDDRAKKSYDWMSYASHEV
jgi:hypothetical protein